MRWRRSAAFAHCCAHHAPRNPPPWGAYAPTSMSRAHAGALRTPPTAACPAHTPLRRDCAAPAPPPLQASCQLFRWVGVLLKVEMALLMALIT